MIPRIFIVDDEAPARARLVTLLSDIAAGCPHLLVGEAEHADQAMQRIAELRPDIVLLDVQMPGMTGVEMASHLMRREDAPVVIFVTAFDEYALKAFEVQAIDYLLKPVRAARLAEAIARAVLLRASGHGRKQEIDQAMANLHGARRHFSIQERGRLLLVPVTDVLYLKAEAKYVTLRTREREYLLEGSLSSLEQEFPMQFIRVHRNALVAREAILGVERGMQAVDADSDGERAQESWQVILRGIDDRLPISRRQWPLVKGIVR
ncbi:DNA-binding response regulator [Oxalicibacterium flavum]|uniref:DNA-binding response regulator n=1 Tax=Oxalicibacterium flavum TaxID=179467 RepID=A0A8J2UN91_9BURK|nr:LytTR family DNA-binding domain-containing protein [Oxalicibacterium flavum]GGB94803.1 DNA-binding response regulator [Oxalicibacterium flavum]